MTGHRPSPPSSPQLDGVAADGSGIITRNVDGGIVYSAVIDDPDPGQQVHLVVRYSYDPKFAHYYTAESSFGKQARRASVSLTRLSKNTLWYVRAYTQDHAGNYSAAFNGLSFYTDRPPDPPTLILPAENAEYAASAAIVFDWQVNDADEAAAPNPQINRGFQIQWRKAGTALQAPGSWTVRSIGSATTTVTTWTMPANTLKAGTTYEWQIRTRDPQDIWGAWSLLRSITTSGVTSTPVPTAPARDVVLSVEQPIVLKWRFSDPDKTATQGNANIRYRVKDTDTWVTLTGSGFTVQSWVLPPETLAPGYHYEWQVQTTRATGADPDSDWSDSAYFWTILTPGYAATIDLPLGSGVIGQLGTGNYRVFIYDQGGLVRRGELKKAEISQLTYNRKRDDISTASVTLTNFSEKTIQLLRQTHTWAHELVIERDKERVWEGPITLITDTAGGPFTISAHDVMAYAYRRIMRQGYNDSYRMQGGVQVGIRSVVDRAGIILTNALGYAEPNVLPYLTMLTSGTDANESRIVPDYTKSAWEEVDDLAANAGLDYTVIGRRIVLFGTHTPVGMLPELSDKNFTQPVTVSEYGMNAANYYAVTDGQGGWGAAYPVGRDSSNWDDFYGPLEMVDSGYGVTDSTDSSDATDESAADLTPSALAALQADLKSQATRNIASRWPAPLTVRIPDNSGITPDTNITLGQLVPGVWIPLRAVGTVRPFAQMQKLDSVAVTVAAGNETVTVVMGPAPISGDDPDAEGTDDGGADDGDDS